MDQSDENLLASFLKGDRSALEELARRYEVPLLGLARALLDGRADLACDAIQETWVRVIRHGHTFRGRSGLKTWLYRIAITQCREAKARAARASIATARAAGATARDPVAQQCDLPQAPEHLEETTHLRTALRGLSPDRRIVLILCYHDGLTHEHAAAILGLPLGTLKTRLRAALAELRARIQPEPTL